MIDLLIASEFPADAPGGGAAIVRQMIKGFPNRQIGWWSLLPWKTSQNRTPIDIQPKYRAWSGIPVRFYPQRRFNSAKGWLFETVLARQAAQSLDRFINSLNPKAVWCIPHQLSIPPLLEALAARGDRLHVSVHDYPHTQGGVDRLGVGRAQRFFFTLQKLFSIARSRDVISTEMAEDLFKKTGRRADFICRKAVEQADISWLNASSFPEGLRSKVRLAYAGTVIVPEVFSRVIAILEEIRSRSCVELELHFFSAHWYSKCDWFNREWMIENGNLSETELVGRLREMDAGIAVMDVNPLNEAYFRFSFPAKFSSYVGSGLPIIAAGHPESTLVRLLERHPVGVILQVEQPERSVALLKNLFLEGNLRNRFKQAILACVRDEFFAPKMRTNLYEVLRMQRPKN